MNLEDVVQVYTYGPFHDEVPEYIVHHSLEGGWALCETKEHYQGFEQPSVGLKGGFPLVTLANANIVVPPANIQLGEILGPIKLIDEFRDEGYGVVIFDRHCIQRSVVLHQPKGAILLLDVEYQGCHWRFGWVNAS